MSGANIFLAIPTTTTQDKKWGIYEILWKKLLSLLFCISLNISANKIGKGKAKKSFIPLIMSVLIMICVLLASPKNRSKYFKPIQPSPHMPELNVNSRNARIIPVIGI